MSRPINEPLGIPRRINYGAVLQVFIVAVGVGVGTAMLCAGVVYLNNYRLGVDDEISRMVAS